MATALKGMLKHGGVCPRADEPLIVPLTLNCPGQAPVMLAANPLMIALGHGGGQPDRARYQP